MYMYVCMYVCMNVCMYVFMYVFMYVYLCLCVFYVCNFFIRHFDDFQSSPNWQPVCVFLCKI